MKTPTTAGAQGRPTSAENDDSGRRFFDKYIDALRVVGVASTSRISRSAPRVAISGAFINEIYESNFEGWAIRIDQGCRVSITDYSMVQEDADGTMLKKKEKDKDKNVSLERYGHMSDCLRYFITSILPDVFQRFSARKKNGPISVPGFGGQGLGAVE